MLLGNTMCGYDIYGGDNERYLPLLKIKSINFGSGGNGVVLDKIWGENGRELTSEDFVNEYEKNYDPNWTTSTYMLADFSGDILNCSRTVPKYPCSFDSYTVHKLYTHNGVTTDTIVASNISRNDIQYKNFKNTYDCTYYLSVNGRNLSTDTTYWCIPTNYTNEVTETPWGYYLVDTTNAVSYFFNWNFDGGQETVNSDYTQYVLNQEKNKYVHGNNNMRSGEIQGILYDGNHFDDLFKDQTDAYIRKGNSQKVLENFREFYNSKRECLLKDRWGNMFNVILTSYSESYVEISLYQKLVYSIVDWKEVNPNE